MRMVGASGSLGDRFHGVGEWMEQVKTEGLACECVIKGVPLIDRGDIVHLGCLPVHSQMICVAGRSCSLFFEKVSHGNILCDNKVMLWISKLITLFSYCTYCSKNNYKLELQSESVQRKVFHLLPVYKQNTYVKKDSRLPWGFTFHSLMTYRE